jgi:hypothetical protein
MEKTAFNSNAHRECACVRACMHTCVVCMQDKERDLNEMASI